MQNVAARVKRAYKQPDGTVWSKLLLVLFVSHSILPAFIGTIPDNQILVYVFIFTYGSYLILMLAAPVIFHFDRVHVMEQTDYEPALGFYAAISFPLFSAGATLYYLYLRGKAHEQMDSTASEAVEEE